LERVNCAIGGANDKCIAVKESECEFGMSGSLEVHNKVALADVPLTAVVQNGWLSAVCDCPVARNERVISAIRDITGVVAALPLL
jgi:hypothetical protein